MEELKSFVPPAGELMYVWLVLQRVCSVYILRDYWCRTVAALELVYFVDC